MKERETSTGIDRILGRVLGLLGLVGAAFTAAIVLLTFADVVMRWFGHPISGVIELSQLFIGTLIWLGVAYTMRVGGHVRMEMLSDALFKGRKEVYYRIMVNVILLAFSILMCQAAYDGMTYSIRTEEFGDITGIPVYPFKVLLFSGCVLFALEIFAELVLHLCSLREGSEGVTSQGVPGKGRA
jgi:C4-dicarboxylate transporter, DctQ subunit